MSPKRTEDDDRLVEEIYDALDDGQPERALAAARIALHATPDDPVLHFLAGVALGELDRPGEAIPEFGRAIDLDPDDPEFRSARAQALLAQGTVQRKDEVIHVFVSRLQDLTPLLRGTMIRSRDFR